MKIFRLSIVAAAVTVLVLTAGVFSYVNSFKKNLVDNAYFDLQQTVEEKTVSLENSINFAQSSIKLISQFCSEKMTDRELHDQKAVLDSFSDKTPFSSIEYIRWDGLNKLDDTNKSDDFIAKDREYYKMGIQGKSGIWPNFKPKYSDEVLINFYTPLNYEGETVGVLTGLIGGQTGFSSIMKSPVYDYPIIYILTDEKFNVISSTSEDIRPAVCLERYEDADFIAEILRHSEEGDTSAFKIMDDGKEGICCVSTIPETSWRLIGIVLPKALYKAFAEVKRRTYSILIFMIVILLVYLVIRFYLHDKIIQQSEQQKYMETLIDQQSTQISMLSSFSGIYYTTHLIDLMTDTLVEIKGAEALRTVVNETSNVQNQMWAAMDLTVVPENLEEMKTFTNISTVAKRLKDKKIISKEFKGKSFGWVRASFITVEVDENHQPFKILFVTQIIDDEKRRVETLIDSAYKDELTGLYNRHAYETDLKALRSEKPSDGFIYAAFDVNSLKKVNDNYGHEAGDELIRGAAICLSNAFGKYGKIYRTGGDEFQAMFFADEKKFSEIKNDFEQTVAGWSGNLVEELSISAGYVIHSKEPALSISETVKLADFRMYRAKSDFYNAHGGDRRSLHVALEAVCRSFKKLLKVNLSQDAYTILQIDDEEKDSAGNYGSSISAWLKSFAESEMIHPDDIEEFTGKTDLRNLCDYFSRGNKVFNIRYRRRGRLNSDYHNALLEIIPANDYSGDNQTVYLSVKNID